MIDKQKHRQPPPPPNFPEPSGKYRLKIIRNLQHPIQPEPARPVDEVYTEMLETMREYCQRENVKAPLLVRIPPGLGKTHAGVDIAQGEAKSGRRVLWASQRRNSFSDIKNMRHFHAGSWYRWLAITDKNPDTREPICKYQTVQTQYLNAGYPARVVCEVLCQDFRRNCPYLNQSRQTQNRIVFARHQHLALGMNLPKFDLVIVDELPLQAFVEEWVIPVGRLQVWQAEPAIQELTNRLVELTDGKSSQKRKRIAGKQLMSEIAKPLTQLLDKYQSEFTIRRDNIKPPNIEGNLGYNWLPDALKILRREFECYQDGMQRWAERIWVSPSGLHLLRRRHLSRLLPARTIILDATGDPHIYKMMFGHKPQVYSAQVKRAGKIYQYVRRTNGKGRLTVHNNKRDSITRDTAALIALVKDLIRSNTYQKPAIVCHKQTEKIWKKSLPQAHILTFGGLRGSNAVSGCDALFVCGSNGLNSRVVINLAIGLDENRRHPFGKVNEKGKRTGIWDHQLIQYRLTETGINQLKQEFGPDAQGAARLIGRYVDPDLDAIAHQFREAELVQAIHRVRPIRHACDVWLLTAVPTSEPVDWLTDSLRTRPANMREDIWEKTQDLLKFCQKTGCPVTAQSLSQFVGVAPSTVNRLRWLESIADLFHNEWELGYLKERKGRPSKALLPKTIFATFS